MRSDAGNGNGADGQLIVLRNGLVDVGAGQFARADVVVDGGRIHSVVETAPACGVAIDCTHFAVVPGMINAHAHSNENWFRGLWDNLPLEPWMLFSYPVLAAPAQTAGRDLRAHAARRDRDAALRRDDASSTSSTTAEESLEPVVRAYRDLGLRALIGARLSRPRVPRDGRARRGARLARPDRPARAREAAAVERAGGVHAPRGRARSTGRTRGSRSARRRQARSAAPTRCSPACAALAEELDLMIHIHVLETRMQAVSGQRMYGRTLPEHMDALGFLSPRVCFEHGIWLTPSDIELVRDRGVTVVHNPVSNMKLGSGIAPDAGAAAPRRQRRARHRRDVLERRPTTCSRR